jgi:hypothetical protein
VCARTRGKLNVERLRRIFKKCVIYIKIYKIHVKEIMAGDGSIKGVFKKIIFV